ncbi:DUF3526 domain-containing protein [Bowmanella sp. Y26]|uniref:DUF3526 domain-containing protein n=1 Tax=Bowmanella yangjiangensis TaxID=2811230 RepID=UPI001BDCD2C6|nr:DUF3526 domain-containing protein [Bowmanella yangjiangensis]MBT1064615.1 DUF3526 domain-containing protein [Bowmanella yangjiangensis]
MSINWTVCCHELKRKWHNQTLKLLFVLAQFLLALVLWNSWQQYQQSLVVQQNAQTMVEEQWLAQPDRHPHRVAHFGHFAFRPPGMLSFFDQGVNSWVGHSIFLEAHKQNSANFSKDDNAELLLRFSELSVANTLLLIWPLLLIAMGFASLSGEKDSGTLRQLVSLGVSFRQLLVGKALAYLLLSLAFILPVFCATLLLAAFSEVGTDIQQWWRCLLLLAVYLLYCLIWVALILLCSVLSSTSRQSLSVLVTLWFVLTVLMPRVLADSAETLYPHLKRNDFTQTVKSEVRKTGNSHNPHDPHFNAFKERILAQYGVTRVEDLPVNYRGLVMQEGERITAEIYDRHYQAQLQRFAQQQAFIGHFYWLNPYLAARDLSMALSGTDSRHFFDFEQQAESHRYARIQQLNKLHVEEVDYHDDRGQRLSASYWQAFPAFHYAFPALSWSLSGMGKATLSALLLFGMLLILLWLPTVQRRSYVRV